VAEAEWELAADKANLAMALRMQMLAQTDLRELQERYLEVNRQRSVQAELLQKLAPRLLLARNQLEELAARSLPAAPEQPGLASPGPGRKAAGRNMKKPS
jgi:hypothetical protein